MRVLRLVILLFCAFALIAPELAEAAKAVPKRAPVRTGTSDPRYAALIMNPKTGEVYHQQNADERRYPASLTKMMTLYLLFEALEQGKVSFNTRMRVSDYASMQPQTNISLTPHDTIPVDTAIKALVVRSANDVAVVVAEHLGGTVPNFAKRMTEKARQLGMRNTVFQNPHGLPNANQVTTARDMAKLSIALKRDFPQYYQYFSTRQFSWKGVTYYTHNRVMLRYSGTDGIKTGFINASGFNVATSTERGGRPLVGVVMGGASGRWRDDRMIQLLDAAYVTIAKQGNARSSVIAKNLPAVDGRPVEVPEPGETPPIRVAVAQVPADRGVIRQTVPNPPPQPVALVESPQPTRVVPARPEPSRQLASAQVAIPPVIPPARHVPPNTLDAQLAAMQQQRSRADAGVGEMWGIQVGAFSSRTLAEQAALQAYQLAQQNLRGSRISVVGTGGPSSTVHRARLENITENQAKKACETLISNNSPCFIFRSGAQNL